MPRGGEKQEKNCSRILLGMYSSPFPLVFTSLGLSKPARPKHAIRDTKNRLLVALETMQPSTSQSKKIMLE